MHQRGRRSEVVPGRQGLSRRTFVTSALVADFALMTRIARGQDSQPLRVGMVRPLTGRFASSYAPLFVALLHGGAWGRHSPFGFVIMRGE